MDGNKDDGYHDKEQYGAEHYPKQQSASGVPRKEFGALAYPVTAAVAFKIPQKRIGNIGRDNISGCGKLLPDKCSVIILRGESIAGSRYNHEYSASVNAFGACIVGRAVAVEDLLIENNASGCFGRGRTAKTAVCAVEVVPFGLADGVKTAIVIDPDGIFGIPGNLCMADITAFAASGRRSAGRGQRIG